jgi:chromosome transmission fidelity protein 1
LLADPTPRRQTTPRPQPPLPVVEQAQGAGAGREYYTNLCMKAVNQSIGRAIRHRRDYSAMLLLDGRYAKAEVRGRLPKWIGARLQAAPNFDAALEALDQFFAAPRAS